MTRHLITMALLSSLVVACTEERPPPGGITPDGAVLDAGMRDARPPSPCTTGSTASWSGLDVTLPIDMMTDEDRMDVCDFGRTLGTASCSGNPVVISPDCEANLRALAPIGCDVTVCELEACFIADLTDRMVMSSSACRPTECASLDECASRL